MSIIYNDDKFTGNVLISSINATKAYLNHFENCLYLKFIANNSNDAREKIQAGKEILIAERKMKFWSNQKNFNSAHALNESLKLKSKWSINNFIWFSEITI